MSLFEKLKRALRGEEKPDTDTSPAQQESGSAVPEVRTEAETYWKVGNVVTFGAFEQDHNHKNGKDPIEWLILDRRNDGSCLLISRYQLANKYYDEEQREVSWETCTLRAWLNNEFYNSAFSEEEKKDILLSGVLADKNPWFDTDPGRDTQDHVFLLSCVEAQRYFQDNAARVCLITKHARLDADTAGITDSGYGTGPNVWWLRSPGCDRAHAAAVNSDGSIGWGMVYPNGYGVRPAIRVRLI